MREQPDEKKRLDIINFLKTGKKNITSGLKNMIFLIEIAEHKTCYRRLLYLEAAESVIRLFSRNFFMEHFLADVIRLTHDNVANVR